MSYETIVRGGGILTQTFGVTDYALACRCEWNCPGYPASAFHAGIDVASPHGEEPELLAVGYGVCVKIGRVLAGYSCSGLGPYAPCIRSGNIDVWYGHAKQSLVKVGDLVVPRQPVAIMDSVGCSTGNHVHYEVVPAGADPDGCSALNPYAYLASWPGKAPASSPAPDPAPAVTSSGLLIPALAIGAGLLLYGSRKPASA